MGMGMDPWESQCRWEEEEMIMVRCNGGETRLACAWCACMEGMYIVAAAGLLQGRKRVTMTLHVRTYVLTYCCYRGQL